MEKTWEQTSKEEFEKYMEIAVLMIESGVVSKPASVEDLAKTIYETRKKIK